MLAWSYVMLASVSYLYGTEASFPTQTKQSLYIKLFCFIEYKQTFSLYRFNQIPIRSATTSLQSKQSTLKLCNEMANIRLYVYTVHNI